VSTCPTCGTEVSGNPEDARAKAMREHPSNGAPPNIQVNFDTTPDRIPYGPGYTYPPPR